MVGYWNTKLSPCTSTFQMRTANLETYLTNKGLASTLHPNITISTNSFCCNSVGMPKADPVSPSPNPHFLQSERYTEGFLLTIHSSANSSKTVKHSLYLPCFQLSSSFRGKKPKTFSFDKKNKTYYHLLCDRSFTFYGGKKLNKAQSFCPEVQNLLRRKYIANQFSQIRIWYGRGVS